MEADSGAVVGAVLTFVTAGALLPYLAGALTSATAAATTAALATVSATVTTAAALATVGISASMTAVLTAVAGIAAGAIGTLASTTITTGSFSQGWKAAGNTLVSGSVSAIVGAVIGVGFDFAGLSGLEGAAGTISTVAQNTLSGAVSQTLLGNGSFADNLRTSAISSVVNVVSADVAGVIGANTDTLGAVGTEVAHGALGCVTGMIRAQSGDGCVPGATGAVVGHLGAGWIDAASGYTLNDNTLSFFSTQAGRIAAAAVGSSDQVEQNLAIGGAAASNAVDNNYLTQRDVTAARALIAANCTNSCDRLMNGLEQTSARSSTDLRGRCSIGPEACSVTLREISDGLTELQSIESQLAFASNPQVLQRLVQRQINDLDQATQGVNFALQNASSLEAIRTVAAVATLGTGATLLGRVLATACAANPSGCTTFANEAAIVMSEVAAGVPYTGLTSPVVGATALGTAAAANRLANAASNGGDMAAAVRQAQTDLAAARAGANVNGTTLAPPSNTYTVYPRGAGASEGPLPNGYTTVSRWVSPQEATLWVQNQGTAIPSAVPRNGTSQVYVSPAGAPRAPGATGTVRIDFAVPNSMLQTGNATNNSIILQPTSSRPIYNVNIHVPNGTALPK